MLEKESKYVSYILRHGAIKEGLEISKEGYVDVLELIAHSKTTKTPITENNLKIIVETDEKGRYVFNENKTQIRATQGHSMNIEPPLVAKIPPTILYHGTTIEALPIILKNGLSKMNRTHVHLSGNIETAKEVGSRRKNKECVILEINTKELVENNVKFFLSENNVWLTENIHPKHIKVKE